MPGALQGFRIIDVTQVISGPLATRILADQGADVIKVEPPSGDILRHMGGINGLSPTFTTTNRSKRSVVLDLKDEDGLALLRDMVAGADVFIQNSRPGIAERMGIGEKELRAINTAGNYGKHKGFVDERNGSVKQASCLSVPYLRRRQWTRGERTDDGESTIEFEL